MDFWALWCDACVKNFHLVDLKKRYAMLSKMRTLTGIVQHHSRLKGEEFLVKMDARFPTFVLADPTPMKRIS